MEKWKRIFLDFMHGIILNYICPRCNLQNLMEKWIHIFSKFHACQNFKLCPRCNLQNLMEKWIHFVLKINESVAESWSVTWRAKIAEKVYKPPLGFNATIWVSLRDSLRVRQAPKSYNGLIKVFKFIWYGGFQQLQGVS